MHNMKRVTSIWCASIYSNTNSLPTGHSATVAPATSVVDSNTMNLNLDLDPGFWPNLDPGPDPGFWPNLDPDPDPG